MLYFQNHPIQFSKGKKTLMEGFEKSMTRIFKLGMRRAEENLPNYAKINIPWAGGIGWIKLSQSEYFSSLHCIRIMAAK